MRMFFNIEPTVSVLIVDVSSADREESIRLGKSIDYNLWLSLTREGARRGRVSKKSVITII